MGIERDLRSNQGEVCLKLLCIPSSLSSFRQSQVSYVRIEAGKGRFAVWQVCDYIVTPRTIYHALAM